MGLQNFLLNKLIESSTIGKKIQSATDISSKGQFALDATEKNPNIEGSLAENIANLENQAKRLENSVKKIVSLPNGASTGDGQIEDAKVGIEGETYDTLGDAIREQIKSYSDVEVSNTKPTNKAKVWVNTTENDNEDSDIVIPEIDDTHISEVNTWSSKKINDENAELKGDLSELEDMIGYKKQVIPFADSISDFSEFNESTGGGCWGTNKVYQKGRIKSITVKTLSNVAIKVFFVSLGGKKLEEFTFTNVNGVQELNLNCLMKEDFYIFTICNSLAFKWVVTDIKWMVLDSFVDPITFTWSEKGSYGFAYALNYYSVEEQLNIINNKYDIVVAKDGSGDFTTVNEALDSVPNGSNIHITLKEGVYDEVIKAYTRYNNITIRGVSRDNCIIKNSTGKYANSPLWVCGNFTIENLTIQMLPDGSWTPTYDYDNVLETFPGYCIHIDGDNINDEIMNYGLIKNCVFYSQAFPAVGMGTHKNQQVEFRDCVINRVSSELFRHDNWQGSFYCHANGYDDQINQRLFLYNNSFCCNYGNAIHIRADMGIPSNFELLAVNNVAYTLDNGFNCCNYVKSTSIHHPVSYGNSATVLNAN